MVSSSQVLLQLPPNAEVSDDVMTSSEACSEGEEEVADAEHNDCADDPGSDDSE